MGSHNRDKTECSRGHPYTPDNTYVNPNGWRICRSCVRDKHKGKRAKPVVVQERAAMSLEELGPALLADLRTAGATYRPLPLPAADQDILLELCPVDAHFGALCWGEETGDANYDLQIAARLYRQAIEGLLARAARERPAAILLRIGDDFLHVDSSANATTNGTPQDMDSRYRKVFRVAVSVAAHAVRRCAELAPTKVVVIPGNHDQHSTFAVGECLAAMFAEHPHVTVSPILTPRVYEEWGTVMLCLTHGDKEVPNTLPLLMAAEQPEMWARTSHREVHMGHLHRKRQMAEDEFAGVRVRWLPSIKATDAWHAGRGFTGSRRAAEAYLWSRARGYLGTLSEPIMEGA